MLFIPSAFFFDNSKVTFVVSMQVKTKIIALPKQMMNASYREV